MRDKQLLMHEFVFKKNIFWEDTMSKGFTEREREREGAMNCLLH